jgi:hypothetical protein
MQFGFNTAFLKKKRRTGKQDFFILVTLARSQSLTDSFHDAGQFGTLDEYRGLYVQHKRYLQKMQSIEIAELESKI